MTTSKAGGEGPNRAGGLGPVGEQRLSATDLTMLSVDGALRGMGAAGFEAVVLTWLSERVDVARLRAGLARLGTCHPVAASRLVEGGPGGPCWRFRPGAGCPLVETELSSPTPECVWEQAARLLSTPTDLTAASPLRFQLFHRPDGRDVFLMQYNHAVMDNTASDLVLREIDRLSADGPAEARPAAGPDPIRDYLRGFPREVRRKATTTTARLWGRSVRGGVAGVGHIRPSGPQSAEVCIATRRLEESDSRALRAHVTKTCGLPSLSMAILGSAFRAIERIEPAHRAGAPNFTTGIGLDLGLRGRQGPLFGNLVSLVPIRVPSEGLSDRAGLVRALNRQMREHIEDKADLGMLQWITLLSRRPRDDVRWVMGAFLRNRLSLWYAYFGTLGAIGDRFCGAGVEEVSCAGPSWPAMGLTLLVNQFRSRLLFQATYAPEAVSGPQARAFLDLLLADLVG